MPVDPAKLAVVHYPEPILREKARPIESIDDQVRAVAARMIELMHELDGVGLAAPQVGLSWRMFVVAGSRAAEGHDEHGKGDRIFINPELKVTDPTVMAQEEGCLSLPGIHVEVRRARAVELNATMLVAEVAGPGGPGGTEGAEGAGGAAGVGGVAGVRGVRGTGEQVTLHADDFLARIWQHEFDHLEGKLIIDRMTPMARLATRKALKEMEAGAR